MVALRQEDGQQHIRRPRRQSAAPPRLRIVDADVLALVRRDTLPDYADYRDTGCELSASCLRCPLARCKYDEPPLRRGGLAALARDREIALLRRRHQAPIDMLAGTYGVTRRTIFRILRRQPA